MTIDPKYAGPIARALARERRKTAGSSPALFARLYLPQAFSAPPCRLHAELDAHLERMVTRRRTRLAVAAPRGHAKSTIVSLAYVLWCLLYKKEEFILLVSGTAEQAEKLLDHVKRQVETNPLLRSDFPELAGVRRISPWKRNSILLPSGAMLMSFSAGQNVRGARHGRHRPTLIVVDDLEDKLQVASEDQRGKLADWFASTLLKAGTPETNVVVVGTRFHHDSLLSNLLNPLVSPGWERLEYRAIERGSDHPELWEKWGLIYRGQAQHEGLSGVEGAAAFYAANQAQMDEGAQVLWKDQYSYRDLMEIRLRDGETSFQAEYQNQPLDPEQCMFSRAPLRFWNTQFATAQDLVSSLAGFGEFYGSCDPGLGGNLGRGDYSAVVIVYKHWKTKVKYVVVADLARRSPSDTIDRIVQYCKLYKVRSFSIESNQFQQLMADDLVRGIRAAGLKTWVLPVKHESSKLQRIASLEPQVSQGLIVFDSRHELLMEQLKQFPLGKHDDGPDALEMTVAESDHYSEAWWDPARPKGRIGTASPGIGGL